MSEAEIKSWIEVAQHDIDTAALLQRENGHPDIVIYHVHQAIEKMLKVFLIKNNATIEKTHNLDRLLKLVIESWPELRAIEKDILEVHYYLPLLRYPTGDQLSPEDAQRCYICLRKVIGVVSDLVKSWNVNLKLKLHNSGSNFVP